MGPILGVGINEMPIYANVGDFSSNFLYDSALFGLVIEWFPLQKNEGEFVLRCLLFSCWRGARLFSFWLCSVSFSTWWRKRFDGTVSGWWNPTPLGIPACFENKTKRRACRWQKNLCSYFTQIQIILCCIIFWPVMFFPETCHTCCIEVNSSRWVS